MLKIDECILGRYRVIDLLRVGGQASISKAVDETSGALVVIRQLGLAPGDANYDSERARFDRAARIRIGHPNVVDPVDAGEDDGNSYMILPFIDGPTLQDFLTSEGGKLDAERATRIIRNTAEGLAACHDRGVTHRDIKPDNILMGPGEDPRIIDFGICSLISEPTITQGDGFMGSIPWAAPEQVFDPRVRDFRVDQYALGAIYYLLLTGEMPVKGNDPEQILHYTCNVTPPPPHELNPSIPVHQSNACMQLLAKNLQRRFQGLRGFIRALDGCQVSSSAQQVCPSCGEGAASQARFCMRCGANMTSGAESAATGWCMACGELVDNKATCPKCRRVFSPADHRIAFTSGALTGRVYRIPMDLFVTGRDSLAPRDFHISRRHLRVACMNGDVMLEDVGSANKTYIDGQVLDQPLTLRPNCQIVIAGSTGIYKKS